MCTVFYHQSSVHKVHGDCTPRCLSLFLGTVNPEESLPEIDYAKGVNNELCTAANPEKFTRCVKCFVSHFPSPNTKICKLKKKLKTARLWNYNLKGGAKNTNDEEAHTKESLF